MSASSCNIPFPRWLPPPARNSILARWEIHQPTEDGDAICSLLKRLATYEAMRTEVWEKLPTKSKGAEGLIMGWAVDAYWVFNRLPRRIPKKLDWAKQREKFTPLTDHGYTSTLCQILYERVYVTKPEADFYWKRFWSGDPTITTGKVIEILDQLGAFYAQLHRDLQTFIDTLPRVNRWNAKAHQKFFSEFLSDRFRAAFDQPLDSIVAALTGVAFDLRDGVASETVRGRRRPGKTHRKK